MLTVLRVGGFRHYVLAGVLGRQAPTQRVAEQSDGHRAQPIGIGLDPPGTFGRHAGFLQLAPIGDDGIEIDGQDAGGAGQRRRRVGFRGWQAAGHDRFGIGNEVHGLAIVLRRHSEA